jgi:hypothetical protein
MIMSIQTFGRAAWHSVIPDPVQLKRLWGFLRWNTCVFITLMMCTYLLILIGNMIVVSAAPNAVSIKGVNDSTIKIAYGVVEAGLVIQSLLLFVFTVLVWRWTVISRYWDIVWDETRQHKWTWKQLLQVVRASSVLLMVSLDKVRYLRFR